MSCIFKPNQKVVIIGDSITDCARRDPKTSPYGSGYVHMINDLLTIREPQKKINVINRGVGGDTIDDLRSRWSDDVLELAPDWLSIKIGINDLNRTLCHGAELPAEKYEQILDDLLTLTLERFPNCKILLVDPFFMSRDAVKGSYRARVLNVIPGYIDAVHRMSEKHGTLLVKTHDLFQEQLKHHKLEVFSTEPVHPYSVGHLLIAEAIYAELSR